ncbi:zf-TFIIB domain-containing protein [Tateyamaria sp. SN6-1]|uniref:TFIIB-type zinc ribbon-containing protein n=1 Tax=Tateyamaria sp. SN6-1 TaxID=3092148 RepID=UPI0039F5D6B9
MKCPIDGTALVIADRSGVEIDYCPACRGVWLDRGELDKIIERSAAYSAPPPPPQQQDYAEPEYQDYDEAPRRKKKRRGGFADMLDDIFDF